MAGGLPGADGAVIPGGAYVVVQRDGVVLVATNSGRMVVELGGRLARGNRSRRADDQCGSVGIRARRAQALAIVTRRDETACGLGRPRR